MFSWSQRRQLLYLLVPLILVLGVSSFIYTKYIYQAPSCFDGIKNGAETGVDCGGSCSLLCTSDTLAPVVLWSKSFLVSGSIYNAAAYVQNPNITSKALNVPYEFSLYDDQNHLITSRQGTITIPKGTNFVVFESGINTSGKSIKRTDFSFNQNITWIKDTVTGGQLTLSHNPLESTSTTPKIFGTATNQTLKTIGPTRLIALIFDGRQNALGVSSTRIDPLSPGASTPFVFTWPHPFPSGIDVCQIPSDVMLVLDRSGSMASVSSNPPQPLTDVKTTGEYFISLLQNGDSVGVVSFGTTATLDTALSPNILMAKNTLELLAISTSTADRNTNIADGLRKAWDQLESLDDGNKHVTILLTDGVPTAPTSTVSNFPTLEAQNEASIIRSQGGLIFTIGLGKDIDADLLKNIAGDQSRFYLAPDTSVLSSIYQNIARSICERKPNVIEILSQSVE